MKHFKLHIQLTSALSFVLTPTINLPAAPDWETLSFSLNTILNHVINIRLCICLTVNRSQENTSSTSVSLEPGRQAAQVLIQSLKVWRRLGGVDSTTGVKHLITDQAASLGFICQNQKPLDVRADAVAHHLLHGDGADEVELVVEAGQVHGQLQVLVLHSPVADPAPAVAHPLRVLQVEGQRAAGAGRAEGVVRTLAAARRRSGGVAPGPVGLGEEGGGVGLGVVAVML